MHPTAQHASVDVECLHKTHATLPYTPDCEEHEFWGPGMLDKVQESTVLSSLDLTRDC